MSEAIAFLEARIDEMERSFEGLRFGVGPHLYEKQWDVEYMLDMMRQAVELHKNWPILLESKPEMSHVVDPTSVTYRVSQQIQWVTQQEYIKRFGTEPPVAPLIKRMLERYQNRPDFKKEWLH